MRYDWDKIETEYVTGIMTMEKLADRHGISHSNFFKHAKDRNFSEKRSKYREKLEEKKLTRARENELRNDQRRRKKIEKAKDKIVEAICAGAERYREYMTNDDMYYSHVRNGKDGLSVIRMEIPDTKAVQNMSSFGRDLVVTCAAIIGKAEEQSNEGEIRVSIELPERTDGDVD